MRFFIVVYNNVTETSEIAFRDDDDSVTNVYFVEPDIPPIATIHTAKALVHALNENERRVQRDNDLIY